MAEWTWFSLKLVTGGEPIIGLEPVLAYPFYSAELGQLFPFRTLCMIIALVTHVVVSQLAWGLFHYEYLPSNWDVLRCFTLLDDEKAAGSGLKSVESFSLRSDAMFPSSLADKDFKMAPIPRPKLRNSAKREPIGRQLNGQLNSGFSNSDADVKWSFYHYRYPHVNLVYYSFLFSCISTDFCWLKNLSAKRNRHFVPIAHWFIYKVYFMQVCFLLNLALSLIHV